MKLIMRYQQFLKFSFAAIGYNLAAYFIYAILIYLKCNYLIASTTSFCAGTILSYFMNKSIVFTIRYHSHNLIIRYVTFYMVLLAVNLMLLYELIHLLKINPYLAQMVVIIASAFISYNTMRMFVFRRK
ncbi:MAG: gtrA-like family protein [Gammaproteobacteria bacterium]|jgi:putative flippase GtrA|nr:gtrA-like family protein [Gammaproteobacteria bacterium]